MNALSVQFLKGQNDRLGLRPNMINVHPQFFQEGWFVFHVVGRSIVRSFGGTGTRQTTIAVVLRHGAIQKEIGTEGLRRWLLLLLLLLWLHGRWLLPLIGRSSRRLLPLSSRGCLCGWLLPLVGTGLLLLSRRWCRKPIRGRRCRSCCTDSVGIGSLGRSTGCIGIGGRPASQMSRPSCCRTSWPSAPSCCVAGASCGSSATSSTTCTSGGSTRTGCSTSRSPSRARGPSCR